METRWEIKDYPKGVHHVMPVGEEHVFVNCRCAPHEGVFGVFVHHAFDEREKFENQERKPS